jgi:Putative Ig domain.
MKSFVNSLLSAAVLLTSVSPASAIQGSNGDLFYRYKAPVITERRGGADDDLESKSVTVFYVAGVGVEFDELLPLKPEWQDDNWRVVSGELPEGITFDPLTRTFKGTPTQPVGGQVVRLEGMDSAGNFVARATVTFDVVVLQGIPVPTTLYAHTNFFKVDELPRPEGMPENLAIESWAHVYAMPDGIDLDNRYIQGTPTKPGTYRLMITGKDYKGDIVATYYGKYIVEDGPTFPLIPDMVRKLPQLEWGWGLWHDISAPNVHSVNYQIDPSRKVRYYLELQDSEEDPLPLGMWTNSSPLNLITQGWLTQPYDTSTVRLKAVDVDGTIGYSNWFTFGSSDPQPDCNPFAYTPFTLFTGVKADVEVPRAYGAQGDVFYKLVEGELPEGLEFVEGTGHIVGTPKNNGDDRSFTIAVDVKNGDRVVTSRECLYTIQVRPGDAGFTDITDPQERHVRVGDYYDGKVAVRGGIPDYTVSFTNPADLPYISFLSPTENEPEIEIGGETVDKGVKSVALSLANGDGYSHHGSVSFEVHDPLSIGPVADMRVKRLEGDKPWASTPYDAAAVIPDVSGEVYPKITYSNTEALPIGLSFNEDGQLVGSTKEPAGTYGPFTATLTDFSGESVTSNDFNVVVEEREPIELTIRGEQSFKVEWDVAQENEAFSVKQPPGAKELALTWSLATADNSTLPSWLSMDDDGHLLVAANTSHSLIGTYGPFVATVTDTEGSSASVTFDVSLTDWAAPAGTGARVQGTVAGTGTGEMTTVIPIPDLRATIDKDTVIGGRDQVTFLSATPENPAGLTFNPATATFTGTPTSAFEGPVEVSFEDARGRVGTMIVNFDVKPYPAASTETNYDLPRQANAEKLDTPIEPEANEGFWNRPVWTVDTTRGTDIATFGLNVDETSGMIIGRTDAAEGTVISNIVLQATSLGANGEVLRNWTAPFSITVGAPIPMEVTYTPSAAKYLLEEGSMALKGATTAAPSLKGSYQEPVTWSLDPDSEIGLAALGLSINPSNGEIVGIPTQFGRFDTLVTATDGEGKRNSIPGNLSVLVTKSGDIEHDGTSSVSRTLRVDEPFTTKPITVTNAMLPVEFSTDAATDPNLNFSSTTGAYEEGSKFTVPGYRSIRGQATDNDGRTFGGNPVNLHFDVRPPLETSTSISVINARQYSAEAEDIIDRGLGVVTNYPIGNIRYSLDGTVPGTLVYRDASGLTLASNGQSIAEAALPTDAIIFDTEAASLHGVPSQAGTFKFRVVAHDDHADAYEMDDPTRITNNTAVSNEVTINVAPASALQLVSSENPKGVVVPGGNGIMSVTPKYAAYGKNATFTVSGAEQLPPGITYTTDGTGVYFSGKFNGTAQQIGNYTGITVSVTDALGRTATLPVSFRVFLSSDAIGLTMTNITTKVGYPVSMQSVADNYYGALRFYSYDLTGNLASQLSLDTSTGLLTGTFTSVADHIMNVHVTDATNRVTSKPLQINVIPNLRVTVPQEVTAEQGMSLTRTVLTDYKLGTVTYEKANPAAWPEGFDVNPSNGTITSTNVVSAAGTYPDLQIRATDTFTQNGSTYTDVQVSNKFSIVITDIVAGPIISPIGTTNLGNVGSPVNFTPYVYDDVTYRAWNYGGTEYSLSHDLSEYGLTFDTKTGKISGAATKSFVIPDLVITVTSKLGLSSSTPPFWIGAAPASYLAVTPTQPTTFYVRSSLDLPDTTAYFDHAGGKLVHSPYSTPANVVIDPDTGAITTTAELPKGTHTIWQVAVDEFGRSATLIRYIVVLGDIEITPKNVTMVADSGTFSARQTASVANVQGTPTFDVEGLPAGVTFDPATGAISGTAPGAGEYPLTVTVTDSSDGATASAAVILKAIVNQGNPRYWKASWEREYGWPARVESFQLLDQNNTNIVPNLFIGGTATPLTDGLYDGWGNLDSIYNSSSGGAAHVVGRYIGIDLGANPPPVSKMYVVFYSMADSQPIDVTLSYSYNGEDWVPFSFHPGYTYVAQASPN